MRTRFIVTVQRSQDGDPRIEEMRQEGAIENMKEERELLLRER